MLHQPSCGARSAMRPARAIVLAALLGTTGAGAAEEAPVIADADSSVPAPEAALQGGELLAALRRGGYVIYFRHTATDFSRNDAGMTGYADCANQRPLNEQGRRDAQAIGATVRALGLPVAEAFASPFCRTMEHARLMLVDVSPRMEVREAQSGDYAGLKGLLAAPVVARGNRWIVGHGIPFRAVAGPPHLAEGEAVFRRVLAGEAIS
ncbi:MAG TPA: histidine phosphatase family protein, partial [Burkholderiaceae bacterium]|nr:histidine phosphatase family protein [Burkholderiaceae bacterium]